MDSQQSSSSSDKKIQSLNLNLAGRRLDRQYESYILNMRADKLLQLYSSQSLRMNRVCPNFIKSHVCIQGIQGHENSIERFEFHNGTFLEHKLLKIDRQKLKRTFEILSTNLPCYEGVSQITDSYRIRAITFNGCPFMQAILDHKSLKEDNRFASTEKSFCEWRTSFSNELSMEQIELIREFKLNLISDMIRDMASEDLILQKSMRNNQDNYIASKTFEGEAQGSELNIGQKVAYSYDLARNDAERYLLRQESMGNQLGAAQGCQHDHIKRD